MPRLSNFNVTRIAFTGLCVVLAFLAGFAVWANVSIKRHADAAAEASALNDAYDIARDKVAEEDAYVTKYLVRLIPNGRERDPVQLRGQHRNAAYALIDALEDVGRREAEEHQRLTKEVIAGHRDYLEQVDRLFAAVDARNTQRAFAIEAREIDPIFSRFGKRVQQAAQENRVRARASLAELDRSEDRIFVGTLVAFSVGAALLLLFGGLLRSSRRREQAATKRELERLSQAALTDNLTGLHNRRAFQEDLTREIEEHRRLGAPLSLAMLDLDGLKRVNDSLGHRAGDERLVALGQALGRTARGADRVYRVGGDEFAAILTGTRSWDAMRFVQRLQADLASSTLSPRPEVTAGLADSTGTAEKDDLIAQADSALIEAKSLGRGALIYSEGLRPDSNHIATALDSHHLKTLATSLARAVDAKDSYTRSHCETVSESCALIGRELGLEPDHIARLRLAGLLHDVGKIGIADAILQKPSKLTDEEFEVMKTHSTLGHGIVSGAELHEQAEWVLHHHERPDGRGYPDGLSGDEVPLESRIILVADAFEAMTSDRPYRQGMLQDDAFEELERCAGTQFDANCVAAFKRALDVRAAPALALAGALVVTSR